MCNYIGADVDAPRHLMADGKIITDDGAEGSFLSVLFIRAALSARSRDLFTGYGSSYV